MPLLFLPSAKPRNLKFRIANTLTVRLFSRFTMSFSFSSRYLVLLSKSLSDALLLLSTEESPLFLRSFWNRIMGVLRHFFLQFLNQPYPSFTLLHFLLLSKLPYSKSLSPFPMSAFRQMLLSEIFVLHPDSPRFKQA